MDFNEIKELIKIFDDSSLSRIKLESKGDFAITLEKGKLQEVIESVERVATPTVVAPQAQTIEKEAPKKIDNTINSPMVGTFYIAPNPGADVFVKKGQTIRKGETLCILEAMKIMNEIEAEFDCKIVDILVEDGQAIEYDMPLFAIERI
jgi:acetyl-CoA carboxylase biotin carboxyl carrier protein